MTIQRPGIMARSRASCAVVGVVLAAVLVVGASGEALTTGLPRTVDPLTGIDQIPSDPRADPLPTPVPSETRTLDAALDQTWWVSEHDGRWVAGTFGGRRVALDVPVDAHLATAFGHIAGWSGSEADGYDVFVIEPTTGRSPSWPTSPTVPET